MNKINLRCSIKMFNLIFLIIFSLLINKSVCTYNINSSDTLYKTYNIDETLETSTEYYLKNDIRPMSISKDLSNLVTNENINSHLSTRFMTTSGWVKSEYNGYVSDLYGSNPYELDQKNHFIEDAKDLYLEDKLISYEWVGCGPTALISQFEFLARSAQYFPISNNLEDPECGLTTDAPNRTELARTILEFTPVYPNEIYGPIFGIEQEGSFTFPNGIINSANELLEYFDLATPKYKEIIHSDGSVTTEKYYDGDSQIYVYGDTAVNIGSLSEKTGNIIDSINRGMPVIWWTNVSGAGDYSNHYMNIYGYEYWQNTDNLGNITYHLMFLLRMNQNYIPPVNIDGVEQECVVYVDSDVMDAANGGFIYFEPSDERTVISPSEYGYECQYFYDEKMKYYSSPMWGTYTTRYLRAGYVNKYDETNTNPIGQEISLSANRDNAGEAYIQYNKGRPINKIYIELSWWSANEGIDVTNGYVRIETKDYNGNWDVQLDLLDNNEYILSTDKENKTRIIYEFSYPTTSFRVYVRTDEPSGTRNKGRIVVGNLMMFHTPNEHDISYNEYDSCNHQEYCACGYSNIVPHVIKYSYINYETFPCMLCSTIIVKNDLFENANIVKRSENYSYLLSNGVIILTDEDIPLYKNGTLIFNDIT